LLPLLDPQFTALPGDWRSLPRPVQSPLSHPGKVRHDGTA